MPTPIGANLNFIDRKLGIFPDALRVHEKGAEIISGNLAHEHTPNYKAQALDFRAALADCREQLSAKNLNKSTNAEQTITSKQELLNHIKYRSVLQPSGNGNTVDGQMEQVAFAENSVRYLAALNFLGGKVKELILAIKGN